MDEGEIEEKVKQCETITAPTDSDWDVTKELEAVNCLLREVDDRPPPDRLYNFILQV